MLDKAMARIQIPANCRQFIGNLFTNRSNSVIGYYGLTKQYDVLIGIDQGEVISPLLWCIYYDPLLVEIHSQQDLGYTMQHSWKPDLNDNIHQSLSARITAQAYMDDTT